MGRTIKKEYQVVMTCDFCGLVARMPISSEQYEREDFVGPDAVPSSWVGARVDGRTDTGIVTHWFDTPACREQYFRKLVKKQYGQYLGGGWAES